LGTPSHKPPPPEVWQLETLLTLIPEIDIEQVKWLLCDPAGELTIEWWMQTHGRVSVLLNHLDAGDEEET
jgi:hypothetical protein